MKRLSGQELDELAEIFAKRYEGWESDSLRYIGARIKKIGEMTPADLKKINNIAEVNKDIDHIFDELSKVTEKSVAEVSELYGDAISEMHKFNEPMYDYRKVPFVPIEDDLRMQAIINRNATNTAKTMINITNTKAIGFTTQTGYSNVKNTLYDVFGKATTAAASGGTTFDAAMRKAIEELGGSGFRIDYGGGYTRRVDSVVRQNVLWGVREAAHGYTEIIADELGCDGFEVDRHSYPRPGHIFLQGRQFAKGKSKTVKGVFYQGSDEVDPLSEEGLTPTEALEEYGCKHFISAIICGVSPASYSPDQLKDLDEKDSGTFEIDGKTKSGYEWSQSMRRIETEIRKEKGMIAGLEGFEKNKEAIKEHRQRISALKNKHKQIADAINVRVDESRVRVYKNT